MMSGEAQWFATRTSHAPPRLRDHAASILASVPTALSRSDRLARAGQLALANATACGSERRAALDLLAADGLITLALLASAETSPAELGDIARALRLGVGQ